MKRRTTIHWVPGVKLRDLQADMIQDALDHCEWNMTATAKALGISKATLYRQVSKLQLEEKINNHYEQFE